MRLIADQLGRGLYLGGSEVIVPIAPGLSLSLSSATVSEDALAGTVIGALAGAGGVAPYSYSIQTDLDANFAVSGGNLVSRTGAAFDYEAATSHDVTVRVTDANLDTFDRTFTISVTNVLEVTLAALTLSAATVVETATVGSVVGAIQNTTAGATLSLTNSAGGLFAISGGNIVTAAALSAGSQNITLRETHADGSNSPRDTVIGITITADIAAPVLTGPLAIDDATGAFSISADMPCRLWLRVDPTGTNPADSAIESGAGALDTAFFDLVSGSNSLSHTFVSGLSGSYQISVVARVVSPSASGYSNVLRDDAVAIDTTAGGGGISILSATPSDQPDGPTLTVNIPTMPVGTEAYMIIWLNGQLVVNTPAGWTQVGNVAGYAPSSTTEPRGWIYKRVIDGTEAATITVSHTTTTWGKWVAEVFGVTGHSGLGNISGFAAFTTANATFNAATVSVTAGSTTITAAANRYDWAGISGYDTLLLSQLAAFDVHLVENTGEAAGTSTQVAVVNGPTNSHCNSVTVEFLA